MKIRIMDAGDGVTRITETGFTFPGYRNTSGRTRVPSALNPSLTNKVACFLGQSTGGASEIDGTYTPTKLVHNLNIYDGRCYQLVDPLLGPSNRFAGGSWVGRFGDKLVSAGYCQRVIAASANIDGTSIADWENGICTQYIYLMINSLARARLTPTHIIQHQGEKDNLLGTSAAAYTASCQNVVRIFRRAGITAPYFVSQTSYVFGVTSAAVRAGQANAVDGPLNIILGPDTDTLGSLYRQLDNLHWSAGDAFVGSLNGANAVADLWSTVIRAH